MVKAAGACFRSEPREVRFLPSAPLLPFLGMSGDAKVGPWGLTGV
jgi:hypothetical protein